MKHMKKKLLKEKLTEDQREDRLQEARDFADKLEFQRENDDRDRAQKKRHFLFFHHNRANEDD